MLGVIMELGREDDGWRFKWVGWVYGRGRWDSLYRCSRL